MSAAGNLAGMSKAPRRGRRLQSGSSSSRLEGRRPRSPAPNGFLASRLSPRGHKRMSSVGYGSSVREAQTATVDSYGDSSDDGSSAQEASAAPPPSAPDGISTRENEHVEKLVMGVRDKNSAVDEPILDFLQKVTVEVMQSYSMDDMDNSLDFEQTKSRPANLKRSLTHAISSVLVVALCQTLLTLQGVRLGAALIVASLTWTWEIGRRRSATFDAGMKKAFQAVGMAGIFHSEEWTKVTSWTWYVSSLVILCTLPLPAAFSGLLVLGFGDPAAGYVGRRWGSTPVPGATRKTFEGALAFLVVGFAASFAGLMVTHGSLLGLNGAVLLSFASAVCGCVGELYHASFAMQLDDNFTVPVLGALGATGMASLALLAI